MTRCIPDDPVLPSLAEYFVAEIPPFVADALQTTVSEPVDVRQGRLCFCRYRPAKRCVFVWELPRPPKPALLISGILSGAGEAEEIVNDPTYQELAERTASLLGGPAYRFLAERQLLLQIFPLDAGLPDLLFATSENWVRENFAAALHAPPESVRVRAMTPVKFKPSRRCALRCDLEVAGQLRRYFAKLLPAEQSGRLLPRMQALADRLVAEGGVWDVPEALFCFPGAGLLVLAVVEGTSTKGLLARASFDPEAREAVLRLAKSAALGLAPFQRAVIDDLPTITPDCLLEDLRDNLQGLERVVPRLADSVEKLIDRLQTRTSRLPPETTVLGHASFRHTHFVLRGEKPTLLDLDGVCLCGPNLDPGNFLAYLDRGMLRRPQWKSVLRECGERFMDGLADLPGLSADWLTWHRTAAQLKGALRSFSSLSSRWPETTQGLIALAEKTLSRNTKPVGVPVHESQV